MQLIFTRAQQWVCPRYPISPILLQTPFPFQYATKLKGMSRNSETNINILMQYFKINTISAWWKILKFKIKTGSALLVFPFLQTPKCLCRALLADPAVTSPLGTFINDVSQKLVLITPFHTSNFYSWMLQCLSVTLFCLENPFPLVTGRTSMAIWIILDPFQCLPKSQWALSTSLLKKMQKSQSSN